MAASKQGGISKQLPKILIYTAILLVLLYIVFIWGNKMLPIKYEEHVQKYAAEYQLDQYLVYSIIYTESHFKPDAKSGAGAMGLMQLLPSTAKWIAEKNKIAYSEEEILQPEKNIQLGCAYYAYLLERFNNEQKVALAAYNGGEGNVKRWLENAEYSSDNLTLKKIPFEETKNYVAKVTKSYEKYTKTYKK